MGEATDELLEEMAALARRCEGAPARELDHLLLLALEREQLVSIAYDDAFLADRLDALALPPPVRALFDQALGWAWRDEQMHTIYVRGRLLQATSLVTRLRARAQELAGAVAGWSSAVSHHVSWRRAPLTRLLAAAVIGAGNLAGRVPRAFRRRLTYLGFPDYCRLQVDAELSAAVCWKRIAELGAAQDGPEDTDARAFARMSRHEEDHEQAFSTLATCFGDDGRPRDDLDPDALTGRLAAIGPFFVPRAARPAPLCDHPLGAGGTVAVAQGETSGDKLAVVREALDDADLAAVVHARAEATGKSPGELRTILKPTFMLAYDRRDRAVFVDPDVVAALADRLRELGVRQIEVAEAPNLYDLFFTGRSVAEVARYCGYDDDAYDVIDLHDDLRPETYAVGLGPDAIAGRWRDADLRIGIGKLRSHPSDFAHLGLGALEGIAGRIDHYLFAERKADRDVALLMPLVDHPPHFGMLEGYDAAAHGLVGVIACPDPARPLRIYAGRDALAVDLVATRHIGLPDATECALLRTAVQWFGDPRPTTTIAGTDAPVPGWRSPYDRGLDAFLSFFAYPVFQHAGARGAVFAPAMDPDAFAPRERPTAWLRVRQAFVRALLGMRPPDRDRELED